jgi:xylulose-5-phosphate/fructose-6-phosphate phosphoketolase
MASPAGMYLQDNPLLREPLKLEHVKPRLLGHWGSDTGQAFTYIHCPARSSLLSG